MKICYIFPRETQKDSYFRYDNSIWGLLLQADVGDALLLNGETIYRSYLDSLINYYSQGKTYLASSAFRKEIILPKFPYSEELLLHNQKLRIEEYDVIFVCCFFPYFNYISFLRSKFPRKIIIGIQDFSLQELTMCHTNFKTIIFNAMKNLDGYICLNRDSYNYFNKLVPCFYLSHPITPTIFNNIKKYSYPHPKNKICLGVSCWNYDFSNLLPSIIIYKTLKERNNNLLAEVLGIRKHKIKELNEYCKLEPGISILGYQTEDYYNTLSRYQLIFNLSERAVAGRICAEAAILGIPIIGNKKCDLQEYCWPNLAIDSYNTEKAYELSLRILSDKDLLGITKMNAMDNIKALVNKTVNEYPKLIIKIIEETMNRKKVNGQI